jgi:hypothetical protein
MGLVKKEAPVDIFQYDEVSLKKMIEFFQLNEKLVYKSTFSFEPYLNKVGKCLPHACQETKGILNPILTSFNNELSKDEMDINQLEHLDSFKTLLSLAMPSMFYENELSFLAPPFAKKFVVKTKGFEELLENEDLLFKIVPSQILNKQSNSQLAVIHILNTFYGTNLDNHGGDSFALYDNKREIAKHYQINVRLDFVKIVTKETPPELDINEINYIIANLDNEELLLKYFPADNYSFEGFAICTFSDITELEVMSEMKNWFSDSETNVQPIEYLDKLTGYLKSYLNISDIKLGSAMLEYQEMFEDESFSLTNEVFSCKMKDTQHSDNCLYAKLFEKKQPILVENLKLVKEKSFLEKSLLKNGIKSIIIFPVVGKEGNVNSIIEIGSATSSQFNAFTVKKLKPIFTLLETGYERFMNQISNQINGIIQQNFTSIHKSVVWKFEEVAIKYHHDKIYKKEDPRLDPIVFKDVYPLYGQSDIVGSSELRNKCIQEDLIKNLELLEKLLDAWLLRKRIHVLESYQYKVKEYLAQLRMTFISSDESFLVNFIHKELRPILDTYCERHQEYSEKEYKKYVEALDPLLGIVYDARRDFEESVTKLISKISEYIETDDREMQTVLPHFFEKYKTDGVEYNVYLGQSILQEGEFNYSDISNFRLWQLVNTCEITRLVESYSAELKVKLKTAQLIFAYNHPLSIRFRMDEKKFDVDGAYNVRYEILKKRIDKAIIKNTDERLTQSGKIAIVYLSEKERNDYIIYFDYLKSKGYTDGTFEDLELEKLQGAEGLKALRISVN